MREEGQIEETVLGIQRRGRDGDMKVRALVFLTRNQGNWLTIVSARASLLSRSFKITFWVVQKLEHFTRTCFQQTGSFGIKTDLLREVRQRQFQVCCHEQISMDYVGSSTWIQPTLV